MVQRATVVVAEDEADVREYLGDVLASAGFSVRVAANGRAALDALALAPPPRILLLDLQMPLMDGDEVLTRIDSTMPLRDVRVCILTGQSALPDRRATAFIRKPFRESELLGAVQLCQWSAEAGEDWSAAAATLREALGDALAAAKSERREWFDTVLTENLRLLDEASADGAPPEQLRGAVERGGVALRLWYGR